MVTPETLSRLAGRPVNDNMRSLCVALDTYGERFFLTEPHVLAQFFAQIAHESGGFRYDREVWGPTPAQVRYDTRTDLGNTPERDGDGQKFAGRTAMQVTGAYNYRAFTSWARMCVDPKAPDFVKQPDLLNTDPWEGLAPIWFWSTHNLAGLADRGDIEAITRRINGGMNGFADRQDWYAKFALELLGITRGGIRGFQAAAELDVDGKVGPNTLAALHQALRELPKPAPKPTEDSPSFISAILALLRAFFR